MEKEPCKAALKLLSCLFTPEELVNGNLSGVTNSKESQHQSTITKLDPARIKYIEGNSCLNMCIALYTITR